MSGDRLAQSLDQERAELILALNGNPVNAAMAWQIIHRWDALAGIAEAARDIPDMDTPETDALYRALARLDSGATEGEA